MKPNRIKLASGPALDYVETGNASSTPLICLHGYTDSWHSFELVLPLLAEHFHVFALSQRGHGDSDRPEKGFAPEDLATDVAQFMDQLQIKTAVIVGHSMGGIIAQRFVLDYPEKVRALVLLNTFSGFSGKQNVAEMLELVNSFGDTPDPVFPEEFQRSSVATPVSEAFMQTGISQSLKVPSRIWKAVLNELVKAEYTEALREVKKPVLLLWGDQDTFALRRDQDLLLEALAGAKLVVYEGYGHSIHWETPDRVAQDITAFVKEVVA